MKDDRIRRPLVNSPGGDAAKPRPGSRVGVARRNGVSRVIASDPIGAGETILVITGRIVENASRHSIQVGEGVHIEIDPATMDGHDVGRLTWRYLNHSCDPSAALVERAVVALRPISRGDEITFDYNTTEYDMATPFRCACGSCEGRIIGGFSRLSPAEQVALEPRLAAHLRSKLVVGGVR